MSTQAKMMQSFVDINLDAPSFIGEAGSSSRELEFARDWTEPCLPDLPRPGWIVKWDEISIFSLLAKGRTGDFFEAKWRNTQVCPPWRLK